MMAHPHVFSRPPGATMISFSSSSSKKVVFKCHHRGKRRTRRRERHELVHKQLGRFRRKRVLQSGGAKERSEAPRKAARTRGGEDFFCDRSVPLVVQRPPAAAMPRAKVSSGAEYLNTALCAAHAARRIGTRFVMYAIFCICYCSLPTLP